MTGHALLTAVWIANITIKSHSHVIFNQIFNLITAGYSYRLNVCINYKQKSTEKVTFLSSLTCKSQEKENRHFAMYTMSTRRSLMQLTLNRNNYHTKKINK